MANNKAVGYFPIFNSAAASTSSTLSVTSPAFLRESRKVLCQLSEFIKRCEKKRQYEIFMESRRRPTEIARVVAGDVDQFEAELTRQNLDNVMAEFYKDFNKQQTIYVNNKNPFSIPELMELIMETVSLKDMKNCRLVCKEWSSTITPKFMYRNSTVQIPKESNLLKKFGSYAVTKDLFPYSNFSIRLKLTRMSDCDFIFRKYGPHMKSLKIELTNSWPPPTFLHTSSDYNQMLASIFTNLPNMSKLDFTVPASTEEYWFTFALRMPKLTNLWSLRISSEISVSSEFLKQLFRKTPNVTSLEVGHLAPGEDNNHWERDSNPMALAGSIQELKKLVKFQCIAALPTIALKSFTDANLKLKHLSIGLSKKNVAEEKVSVENFLLSQKETLEVLHLEPRGYVERGECPPISVRALTKLRLIDMDHVSFFAECVSNMIKFSSLPKLERACLCESCVKCFSGSRFEKVKEIQWKGNWKCIHEDYYDRLESGSAGSAEKYFNLLNCEMLGSLRTMFPSLTKFSNPNSSLPYDVLKWIFKRLNNLEELDLMLTDYDIQGRVTFESINYVLGGIPPGLVPTVTRLMSRSSSPKLETHLWIALGLGTKEPENEETRTAFDPSLRDMTKLKRLRIQYETCYYPQNTVERQRMHISETAVVLAFLRMIRLSQLTLLGDISISDGDAAKLRKHHDGVLISKERTQWFSLGFGL